MNSSMRLPGYVYITTLLASPKSYALLAQNAEQASVQLLCSSSPYTKMPHLLSDGMAFPSFHAVNSWHKAKAAVGSAPAELSSDALTEDCFRLHFWLFLPAGICVLALQIYEAG